MDFGAIFQQLGASVLANTTLQAVFLVSLADFILGTLKAIQDKSFNIKWIDAWVGDHVVKAIMISFAIVFGIIAPPIQIGDVSISIVGITAEAAGVAYVAKTIASIVGNLNFGSSDAPPASLTGTAVVTGDQPNG